VVLVSLQYTPGLPRAWSPTPAMRTE